MTSSCARKSSGFKQFYYGNKKDADFALGVPKWIAMPFVAQEDKKEIKKLLQGMKKAKLMVKEDNSLIKKFDVHAQNNEYESFFYTKDDGDTIEIFLRKDGEDLREIVLAINSDSDAVVIAALGKVNYQRFMSRIGSHLNNSLSLSQ